MDSIISLLLDPGVNPLGAAFKLALSLLLGASIGLERRRKGQIAGMRTFALISMGATLAMLVSIYIPQEYMGLKNGDPGRIAAQVISGIGFLGAGAIIQMKGSVRGLTTAAGIWMTASIGLAVGAGMYIIATVASLLIIFILVSLERYEHRYLPGSESKIIRIKTDGVISSLDIVRKSFNKYQVHIQDEFMRYDYRQGYTTINFIILAKENPDYMAMFKEIQENHPDIRSITLTNELNN